MVYRVFFSTKLFYLCYTCMALVHLVCNLVVVLLLCAWSAILL
jgi:hypothetical protein